MAREVDIRSVSRTAAGRLLRLSPNRLREHIRRGLPTKDRRIDLVVYGAWLNRDGSQEEMSSLCVRLLLTRASRSLICFSWSVENALNHL
ncbi:MAG: hypothetical protein AMK72_15025 [Planctomycetes bacterium SM23_25]|nr:MAG: hypothetical protein AMK72_15025 [Planctomycetes bacterium SM23_25]